MKTKLLEEYLAPDVEVIRVAAEQGFSGSNMEQIGNEKDEQEW